MTAPPFDLAEAALAEMLKAGFHPQLPPDAAAQLAEIQQRAPAAGADGIQDARSLPWSSIDNATSRDLDQVECAEQIGEKIRISVGIADVAHAVGKGTPLDLAAAEQAQTVYTAVRNFPMLPSELSTDLTSLNEGQDRAALVIEFDVAGDGTVARSSLREALVRNGAKLAYVNAAAFLEGTSRTEGSIAASPELQAQLRLQSQAAVALHARRVREGALEFSRAEADPVVVEGHVQALTTSAHNAATSLVEELMIAVNEIMARTLSEGKRSCLRRVVRSPERWGRIVELVRRYGTELPATADSGALNTFLQAQHTADPLRYPDLALAVIKLMGPGEYVLSRAGDETPAGHFGLAARDYAHSTAPNRRYADLVTQRIVKAMLAGQPGPYTDDELERIATHCNERDAAARKVERAMTKRVAAVALGNSIGRSYRGVVTGASPKGVYVRVFDPPVEGRIVHGQDGLDVGDVVNVKLLHTDPERAFIDFAREDDVRH